MAQKLKFDDGWEVDVSGKPRTVNGPDGKYVAGRGQLIPVDDDAEAEEVIGEIEAGEKRDKGSDLPPAKGKGK